MLLAITFGNVGQAIPAVSLWLDSAWGEFSRIAAGMLVTSIWQGMIVASALAICLKVTPRISAAYRFVLWAGGFAVIVCLPFWPWMARIMDGSYAGSALGAMNASAKPLFQLDIRWGVAIAAIWLAASLYRAADLAIHALRLRRVWKSAIPVEVGQGLVEQKTAQAGFWGRGRVQLCTSTMLQRPSVIGFFAPRILIPDWLLGRLTPGELEQIVLHELEHLRRLDDWTNLLQKFSLVLFPLNPALLWMEHRLCIEREMACDEGVVRITNAPRAYAACLAGLAERGLERRAEALSLGIWRRRPELVQRVHRILLRKHSLSSAATVTLLGAMGCGLLFGSVELAKCPQLIAFVPAQKTETAKTTNISKLDSESAQTGFAAAGNVNGLSGVHAEQTVAMMPAVRATKGIANKPSLTRQSKPAAQRMLKETDPKADALREQLAMAEANPARTDSGQDQHWIVLTQWEQVQTTRQGSSLSADYEAEQSGGAALKDGDRTNNSAPTDQMMNEITIMQLIMRVIPSNPQSSQHAVVPIRSGWFVFQL